LLPLTLNAIAAIQKATAKIRARTRTVVQSDKFCEILSSPPKTKDSLYLKLGLE
jgi:hypothetical protein